jgi:hypothetical protein
LSSAFDLIGHCGGYGEDIKSAVKRLRRTLDDLKTYVHEPDIETQAVETNEGFRQELTVSGEAHGASGAAKSASKRSTRVSRSLPKNKIEYLRLELTAYKEILLSISELFGKLPIFLIMDDFYFVEKNTQPDLIDYFHRLTKGTELFLKLDTIKHRSKLYRRTKDQYVGVELGHDVFEVDMDYTLDNFDELCTFMQQLLQNAVKESGASIKINEMFAGDGFPQLCLRIGRRPSRFSVALCFTRQRGCHIGESNRQGPGKRICDR